MTQVMQVTTVTMETMEMTTTKVMAMKMDMMKNRKENDDVEEITEESTHLAMAEDGGVEETMESQEPMDVVEEVPTAHAAVSNCPKRGNSLNRKPLNLRLWE